MGSQEIGQTDSHVAVSFKEPFCSAMSQATKTKLPLGIKGLLIQKHSRTQVNTALHSAQLPSNHQCGGKGLGVSDIIGKAV